MKLAIEPHYLGSLEYYSLLTQYDEVALEVNDRFQKQTFRNRCYFLTSNSIQPLILPLRFSNTMLTKDVTIDHSQRWKKDHWGAFYSAYGKAPFFEHFSESFNQVWESKHKYLIDINLEFLQLTLKLLQVNVSLSYAEKYLEEYDEDYRSLISTKKPFTDRKIYQEAPYSQLFGDTFVPNLSIVDLIMCEGPQAVHVLTASFLRD